jgi:hypothetical protein
VAQGVGSEFKSQYREKKTERKITELIDAEKAFDKI